MMAAMGHIEVAHVDYYLPDGRMLLSDASFRVGQGVVVALVGPNGAGKTTLSRLISGELQPHAGTVTTSGGLGVMPQFVGSVRDDRTVRDLLASVARPLIKDAARAIDEAETAVMERDDESAQMAHAFLPVTSWLEKQGTYVNRQGRLQLSRASCAPFGNARGDLQVLEQLASLCGLQLGAKTPDAVFARMAAEIPELSGMSHFKLGRGEGSVLGENVAVPAGAAPVPAAL